ncbi:hypothetical protein CFC21_006215 [Triticum aestivum]|uniref:Uncharacterized protein n=3 Tax=Triticum TaxID=4564 RepID=A0A9R0RJL9_TRITD|nr:hypothetical protein CFC21_006215 [Triticum aestivum]VAH59529.1 unnamed protein product [Triticum turgidum subsp. durum]
MARRQCYSGSRCRAHQRLEAARRKEKDGRWAWGVVELAGSGGVLVGLEVTELRRGRAWPKEDRQGSQGSRANAPTTWQRGGRGVSALRRSGDGRTSGGGGARAHRSRGSRAPWQGRGGGGKMEMNMWVKFESNSFEFNSNECEKEVGIR